MNDRALLKRWLKASMWALLMIFLLFGLVGLLLAGWSVAHDRPEILIPVGLVVGAMLLGLVWTLITPIE